MAIFHELNHELTPRTYRCLSPKTQKNLVELNMNQKIKTIRWCTIPASVFSHAPIRDQQAIEQSHSHALDS